MAKFSYNKYEEAVEACRRYMLLHPKETRLMSAYKCDYCGKWHIGHTRIQMDCDNLENIGIQEAS